MGFYNFACCDSPLIWNTNPYLLHSMDVMRYIYFIIFTVLVFTVPVFSAPEEIDLSGTWQYCLLKSEKDYPPVPATVWRSVQLPERNLYKLIADGNGITAGYVLYRRTFTTDRAPGEDLLFQAGEIMNTDIVYINGKKAGHTGKFPPGFRSGWAKFRSYPVPPDSLVKGQNTIDIVSYFNAELWVISPLRFIDEERGNHAYMVRNFLQIDFIQAFCMVLLGLSLFFMLIFIKRRKECEYFYYACSCFFLADMTILQFVENLYPYTGFSSGTIYKICATGLIFFPPFLAFFFRSYLGRVVTLKRIGLYLLPPLVCWLLMVISQDRHYVIFWRNAFLLIVPLYITDIVIVSIRQIFSGDRKGVLLFIALLPIFIFGIYDILVFVLHLVEGSVPLYPLGVPFVAALIGMQLINRFIYHLNAAEELNILLQEKMTEGERLAALDKELSIARRIQLANVPAALPESATFSIGVRYIPAENISGDFYNCNLIDDERLSVIIADVSGHGVPASLIASMLKVLFHALAPVHTRPDTFISELNRFLFDKMEGNFLTAGYCYIDMKEKKALYARAGHEPLYHIRRGIGGAPVLSQYKPHGRMIGVDPELEPELEVFSIEPGDRIVLYTDCLIETLNDENEMFGDERTMALLLGSMDLSAEESAEHVYRSLLEWSRGKLFEDDFTLIIIDIH